MDEERALALLEYFRRRAALLGVLAYLRLAELEVVDEARAVLEAAQ